MTTPWTPYDAEITATDNRHHRLTATRRKEGYLRALADMQPRIDALVAALERLLAHAGARSFSRVEDAEQFARSFAPAVAQARAALKPAGKE